MKNIILSLITILSLLQISCDSRSRIIHKKMNSQNTITSLKTEIENSMKPNGPLNPNAKAFTLYKVYFRHRMTLDGSKEKCNFMQFVADNLTRRECLDERKLNRKIDKDTAMGLPQDFDGSEDLSTYEYFKIIPAGPHKGQKNWEYHCLKSFGISKWKEHNCPNTKTANN